MLDYSYLTLYDHQQNPIKLSDLWHDQPTLLFFLRSPGCSICRQKLFELRQNAGLFNERNINIVAISSVSPIILQGLIQQYQLPFPMYSDVGGKVYEAFGFRQTNEEAMFKDPEVLRRAELAAAQGFQISDTLGVPFSQLGGIVLFERGADQPFFVHVADPVYVYPEWQALLDQFDTLEATEVG